MAHSPPETENEIKIDKEGSWFYNNAPIVNRNVFLLFCKHLEKDPRGGYRLRIDRETCPVTVEDAPFVVVDAVRDKDNLKIQLNDETVETLDLKTFYIAAGNVPYCTVKNGAFRARFLRKAYYRIAEYFEQDGEDSFFIRLGGKRFDLRQEDNSK